MSKKKVWEMEKEKPLIYGGPEIPGVAACGALFVRLPETLARHVAACPALADFLAPPEKYLAVKREAEQTGSLLHARRLQVLGYLKKGR